MRVDVHLQSEFSRPCPRVYGGRLMAGGKVLNVDPLFCEVNDGV